MEPSPEDDLLDIEPNLDFDSEELPLEDLPLDLEDVSFDFNEDLEEFLLDEELISEFDGDLENVPLDFIPE